MEKTTYTTDAARDASYDQLFKTFASGKTKDLRWRQWQLKQLWWLLVDNEQRIFDALRLDLNRHDFESLSTDLVGLKKETMEHIEHLAEWTADVKPDAGFVFSTLGKARIKKEPLGVTLIIGAWNFPFLLTFQPMIAAITAGCCVALKPSELAVNCSNLIEELVSQYMDPEAIQVFTGGPRETGLLLEKKFNHIFFTGSSKVARFITAAAAKHLTPVVLELGGQGPVIVTENADIDLAAKRICYAKFLNAGQICLSVNHVFAHPKIHDLLIERMSYWNQQYLQDGGSMTKIVNERNWDRLQGLLTKSEGQVISNGKASRSSHHIPPTIVTGVTLKDSLLADELFGPIAPVIEADVQTAVFSINNMPHPLAIYIFSNSTPEVDSIVDQTISGGVTVNDVLMHAAVPNAPFGGVGESGYGYYHGKHGVDCFSHSRTILQMPMWLEKVLSFRYPPFDMKHASKVAVRNKLGFKRGESLEEQRVARHGGTSRVIQAGLVLAAFSVLYCLRGQLQSLPWVQKLG